MSTKQRIEIFLDVYVNLLNKLQEEKPSNEAFERGMIAGEICIIKNLIKEMHWILQEQK